ncbi:MAG: hypothetical protein IKC88_02335 [Opitutales bacterium]|nr:hypothetical protein [Opitutales bacterium]
MRIYLTIFLATFWAMTCFAESAVDFFSNGLRYYLRRDYDSAQEMFKHSENEKGEVGAQSKFYLASISAFKGDKSAYEKFESLLKNPPKDMLNKVAVEYAKFAIANNDYKRVCNALSQVYAKGKTDSLVDWYYAQTLSHLGETQKAKDVWNVAIKKYFDDKSAMGADLFVEAYLDSDKFAKLYKPEELPSSTPAGKARIEIMQGQKVSQPQADISLLAQIDMAESGEKIDQKLLSDTVYKYRESPIAWRGSLALSTISFKEKKYKIAETYARDAELLAPPEMDTQKYCLIALADALRLQKKYDDAIYYYQKIYMARRMGGEICAEAIYKTGICYYEQGQWANAHVCFERVFVMYFNFEYWGSRAYYYDARALFTLGLRRDANATLLEYFRRAKDRKSEIYQQAKKFYDGI